MAVIHQLNRTFYDILSKSGAFSYPELKHPGWRINYRVLKLQRFSKVLSALLSVLNTFKVL